MQIDNLIINEPLSSIIIELKAQLADRGIHLFEKMFDSGEDLMVCCPYHKNGQERKPSAGIRKSDGLFHCLACGETHSLPEMISYCFGYNDVFGRQGLKWLAQNFASAEIKERGEIQIDFGRNFINNRSSVNNTVVRSDTNCKWDSRTDRLCIKEEELDKYRYTHKYMYERGLNDSVIDLFDIGYDSVSDSITFPVKDSGGNCIFIARRSVHTKRFDLPKGIEKPLYGAYEIWEHYYSIENELEVSYDEKTSYMPQRIPKIYVCEGLFDCLRLWCNGKFAVAGFGCLFSDLQIRQLRGLPTRNFVLALDNDKAGREATNYLREVLTDKMVSEVVIPNNKKDIGELSDDEIQNLEEVF